jgi:hypothetical protein
VYNSRETTRPLIATYNERERERERERKSREREREREIERKSRERERDSAVPKSNLFRLRKITQGRNSLSLCKGLDCYHSQQPASQLPAT